MSLDLLAEEALCGSILLKARPLVSDHPIFAFMEKITITIIIIIIIPLFTLGSIYSTNASGTEQMLKTNNSNQTKQG